MKIEFSLQPDDTVITKDEDVLRLLSADSVLAEKFQESASISLAVPVYALNVEEAAAKSLGNAHLIRWRSFVFAREKVLASIDYKASGRLRRGEIITIHSNGELLTNTIEAVGRAEEEARSDGGVYEVRLLLVQSIYVLALWLHDPVGRENLFIPIPPIGLELNLDATYEENEFLEILAQAAIRRLEMTHL